MDGKVHTYKARLVAKGYTQTYGINYEETFLIVAKIKSIRIMLAIAAFHDYEIWQMDVKTTFLNGKLSKDVFMENQKVLKMQSILNECASFKRPFMDLNRLLVAGISASMRKSHSLDFLEAKMRNDILTLQNVKDWLGKCFAMKALGDATYILGIKIYRDRMSQVPYASAVGSIMYAMTCTRPDVSFALSMVSQHQQNPGEGHWTTVKNILKYLRNTKDRFLVYGGEEELRVTGYCDKSSKQDTVADFTCEFEYIAACETLKEAIWMKNFIRDLGVVSTIQDLIKIFYDNENAIALTKEPKDHVKSKHIERKYHFVRSKVEEGHVIVKHI
ncbi:putative RNA-directed DNA polymerase [Tanacetum coccineum]